MMMMTTEVEVAVYEGRARTETLCVVIVVLSGADTRSSDGKKDSNVSHIAAM